MSKNKNNLDFLDELFEKHLNDDQFINTSVSEFTRMIKDSINEQSMQNGHDSLQDMVEGELRSSLNTERKRASKPIMKEHYLCRYDYFVDAINNHEYLERNRGYYKEGHQRALLDMIELAQMNKNNLCALEKIIDEQLRRIPATKDDLYASGYVDGLKLAQKCLIQSKLALMEEINQSLKKAIQRK